MCGIAGILDAKTPPTRALLERMAVPLAARGPDDQGILIRDRVGLVHRRLSIIDLAGGRQPILSEDGTLALVCNGEVYGFRALRRALKQRGHRFRSHTDSEVILHLYEEEGPDCLRHLNGMFAFALVHLDSGRLFLARDRFGQKPLFYARCGQRFAFASGPAALRCLDWVDARLDFSALHDYLEYQYVPAPRSVHRGIRKLPPGAHALLDGDRFEIVSYWTPRATASFAGTEAEAAAEIRTRLEEAVRTRLVADVPLGSFLSGGMDSSLITALARAGTGNRLKTFSIGFPEARYDERAFAAAVARHLGTEHHFLEVCPDSFEYLATVVGFYEEPFCDASMLPTALLSRFTREHVTVALSGDGADELFGGYYRYRIAHWLRLLRSLPGRGRRAVVRSLLRVLPPKTEERTFRGRLRRLVELGDVDGLEQYLRLISRFPERDRYRLYSDAFVSALGPVRGLDVLEQRFHDSGRLVDDIMCMDCRTYLPDDILVKVDRASMAYALEVRSPFLDPNVAELALTLPYSFKQGRGCRKRILRRACADLLPANIFARPKMGFGMPLARWFRAEWREPARNLLLRGRLVQELLQRSRLEQMLDENDAGRADWSYAIFALVVLELWLQQTRPPGI